MDYFVHETCGHSTVMLNCKLITVDIVCLCSFFQIYKPVWWNECSVMDRYVKCYFMCNKSMLLLEHLQKDERLLDLTTNKADAMEHTMWKKLIQDIDYWMICIKIRRVSELFFWYWLTVTQVVLFWLLTTYN